MKIRINDEIPDIDFYQVLDSGPKKINSKTFFKDKKIILVAVPGAFTPTCSAEHLPGFADNEESFYSKGIDEIVFVSVNDPFVMAEWGKVYKNNKIKFIADPYAEFAKKTNLILDLSEIGLGIRLSRFAMLIDNGVIIDFFDEDGGGLEKSSAESVLKSL